MTHGRGLRLLTYNLKLLPRVAKLFDRPLLCPHGHWERRPEGLRDHARAVALAQVLRSAEPSWDVLCFQEVFDPRARRAIEQRLVPAYRLLGPFGGFRPSRPAPSGLLMATRLPVVSHQFIPFQAASGTDRFSDKGIVHLALDASVRSTSTRILHVFATHMQAWPWYSATRRDQLEQARSFIARRLREAGADSGHAALLCGDLNVVGEGPDPASPTEEYEDMRRLLGPSRDLYREHHPDRSGFTWNSDENPHMTGDPPGVTERLDYIIALDAYGVRETPLRTLRCLDAEVLPLKLGRHHLSDHFAVEVVLDL